MMTDLGRVRFPAWLRRARGASLAGLLVLLPAVAAAQEKERLLVDLELVLAVDASGSVDEREYRLQMAGIAVAFRDPEVLKAIESGPYGQIAVALLTWAEATEPKDFSGWHLVASPEDAERLARLAESFPRRVAGGTGIGQAVAYGVRLIERNEIESLRKVIDLSGDGKETAPRAFTVMPRQARFVATARGVTVNGLAILNEVPDLETYYRTDVIAGSEAFALSVARYEDFAAAMTRKLIREISYRPKVSRLPGEAPEPVAAACRVPAPTVPPSSDPRCATGPHQTKLAVRNRSLQVQN